MTELIYRTKALELIDYEILAQKAAQKTRAPIRKREARAAEKALTLVSRQLLALEPEDPQIYDYAELTDHYRLIPCDDDVRCHHCGYKRPRPRGEEINFCSMCGCCFGLKE